ncbi:MAG: hypothetical protein AB1750_16865 [Chloroflexota bacterium]
MSKLPLLLRYFILAAIGIAILVLLIGGIGWLFGWRAAVEFSNGFFIVGAILAVFGAYSAIGGFGMRAHPGVNVARTASPASLEERNKQMIADMMQGTNAAYLLVFIGLLLIGIAVLIPNLFG